MGSLGSGNGMDSLSFKIIFLTCLVVGLLLLIPPSLYLVVTVCRGWMMMVHELGLF